MPQCIACSHSPHNVLHCLAVWIVLLISMWKSGKECFQLVCALYNVQLFQCIPELVYTCTQIWLDVDGEPSSYFISSPHQVTPLHKAARRGHVSTVEYLIQEGADISIKDNHGVSEWEHTTDWGLRMLINLWLSLVTRHLEWDWQNYQNTVIWFSC